MIFTRGTFLLLFYLYTSDAIVFDYYSGQIATEEQLAEYRAKGNLEACTIDVEPCCATEWKRVDGSCNNIDNPTKGTFSVPMKRVLPALYYNGSYSRKAASGKDLRRPRTIRRMLLSEGKFSDPCFTHLMTSYAVFMFTDIGSIHDILFFLQNKTDCCSTGMKDYMCTPNFVDPEDTIHRLGGVCCMNMTRPLTYQYLGCTKDSLPSPIVKSTSSFDLSPIYNTFNRGERAIRSFEGGRIIAEEENDKIWPQKGEGFCPLNEAGERCFANHPSKLMSITVFVVWFLRLHNYFATELAKVNPCWDDDQLFYTARDINIACAMQIFLYEWLAQLEGRKNLEKAGIICKGGFRDLYDCDMYPIITLEYSYMLRWFHTVQESNAKMYDEKGNFLRDYPMFNLTFRPGFLAKDKNIEYLTQGQFRQPCGRIDQSVDHEVANNGMPGVQRAVDVTTSDLHKGRLIGLRPYIDYVEYCTGHKINCFDDLKDHIDKDRINELKKVYDVPSDIDLLAGVWVEKLVKGGHLPRTLACLINDNLLKAIKGDRHWYERPNRPHAFTEKQLKEIRKFNLALLLCTVGDGVTEIQRDAFRNICPESNPLVKCCDIPTIDFTAWADPDCECEEEECCKKKNKD